MARFCGDIHGRGSKAFRQGSKATGIVGHIRGFNVGAKVHCFVDKQTGEDRVLVYVTSGSEGKADDKLIADLTE